MALGCVPGFLARIDRNKRDVVELEIVLFYQHLQGYFRIYGDIGGAVYDEVNLLYIRISQCG
jgi:hypothetical protein